MLLTPLTRLFLVFVTKLSQLRFLRTLSQTANAEMSKQSVAFSPDDDLDLGLYYLRTLSNILRWAPDAFFGVLATRLIEEPDPILSEISKFPDAYHGTRTDKAQPELKAMFHCSNFSSKSA